MGAQTHVLHIYDSMHVYIYIPLHLCINAYFRSIKYGNGKFS